MDAVDLLMGNMMLARLKYTSVSASRARACTLELGISRQYSQQMPFTTTVLAMMMMAGRVSWTMVWSPLVSRLKHSSMTWKKDVIMMTEKTRTPMGSSLRLPMGYA